MQVYTNPIHAEYFADPFVWRHDHEYYAIGTGPGDAEGLTPHTTRATIFPLLRSHDMIHWTPAGHALIAPDEALGLNFWAPEIAHAGGLWYLYYSVGHGDKLHQLRVAVSDHPLGPYRDRAQLTNPKDVPFAIDPHPFQDDDGRWYLFHARDFLDTGSDAAGSIRAGTALVVSELETMTRLSKNMHVVLRSYCDWQLYAADRPMYGKIFDWHTLEGPSVIKEGGRYYCIYSGGSWQTDTYGVDYTASDHVLGPYSIEAGVEAPRILKTVPGKVIGPGHCSIAIAPDDSTRMIIYHAWDPEMRARRMCMDELYFEDGIPKSDGPTWTPTELPRERPHTKDYEARV
ncbi:MAG TPA: glycoside hydrolase family 43 protein [Oligoflexus sp.]|uniref:glycoside hydrolase family 43 protein n=1 Tax=Oligoflexus sp. TaxID=1971216 RepID=UPI002D80035C|nr:glycoside hydrolase family 43 protein [Oligoflexus sp.]HET9237362.1 glycoside hydrolase family 43 protein [Oligoflexus sp.]